MLCIVDTNKLFSAVFKRGGDRAVLLFSPVRFVTLEYALDELDEHKGELMSRAGITLDEYRFILNEVVLPALEVYSVEFICDVRGEALSIAREFRPDDWLFIALALKLGAAIWTDDGDMIEYSRRSRRFRVVSTRELLYML